MTGGGALGSIVADEFRGACTDAGLPEPSGVDVGIGEPVPEGARLSWPGGLASVRMGRDWPSVDSARLRGRFLSEIAVLYHINVPGDAVSYARMFLEARKFGMHVAPAFAAVNLFCRLSAERRLGSSLPSWVRSEVDRQFRRSGGATPHSSTWRLAGLAFGSLPSLQGSLDVSEEEIACARSIESSVLDFDDAVDGFREFVLTVRGALSCEIEEVYADEAGDHFVPCPWSESTVVEVPEDVLLTHGDVIRPPLLLAGGAAVPPFARAAGCPGEFTFLAPALGVSDEGSARHDWYGHMANRVRMRWPVSSLSMKVISHTVTWTPSDPPHTLDIVSSLSEFPLLIPGVTTRRWKPTRRVGSVKKLEPRDVLVVVDSSSSMDAPAGDLTRFDLAAIAAISVLRGARPLGVRASVVNFSHKSYFASWSRNWPALEAIIATRQGGGTNFPRKAISKVTSRATGRFLCVFLSDIEFDNSGAAAAQLRAIAGSNDLVVGSFSGADEGFVRSIRRSGAAFVSVDSERSVRRVAERAREIMERGETRYA